MSTAGFGPFVAIENEEKALESFLDEGTNQFKSHNAATGLRIEKLRADCLC
jgi:hypothetical protein